MDKTFVLGLMSGTSVDALDLCYCCFWGNNQYQILATESVEYNNYWHNTLNNITKKNTQELLQLNAEYGVYLGHTCLNFIKQHKLKQPHFIASHGHTVYHNPTKKHTLQIGSGAAIFSTTNIPVICDFRTQDVALGGQGAPLVPIGDQLLFSQYDACLNLGGFSNISYQQQQQRIAFDICPVNLVLNFLANQLGMAYDNNGDTAAQGSINQKLLQQLNHLDYYQQPPPKSLGIEFCFEFVFPLLNQTKDSPQNKLRTFVQHSVCQISKTINQLPIKEVLVTGGGAFNLFLIHQLQQQTNAKITLPSKEIIAFKEALIFAYLGYLKYHNRINVLSSVTGAKQDHSSGVCYGFGVDLGKNIV